MKQLHVLGVMSAVTVLVAGLSVAEEDAPALGAGGRSNPLNAVVKLEVTTAKPDIYCPWITRTGGGTGSGVVIDKGRILTCAHCVTDACYIRVRKHNEDSLYHGSVQFVDAHDLLDDEDVRVYALKDQLARVANPKLHYTYRAQMDGGGNEESLRQAELSHESYLKFLESMEDVYQKIESGDDSVKVGGLPDRKTCANVMVMLRKIGDLPY